MELAAASDDSPEHVDLFDKFVTLDHGWYYGGQGVRHECLLRDLLVDDHQLRQGASIKFLRWDVPHTTKIGHFNGTEIRYNLVDVELCHVNEINFG